MQWKPPKNTDKYYWTEHVQMKMRYYGLSQQKILGVISRPKRTETGIVENTVAVMQPTGTIKKEGKDEKWNQEIWILYQIRHTEKSKLEKQIQKMASKEKAEKLMKLMPKKLVIISAWRYPGVSPKKDPIPAEILRELEELAL